MSRAWSGLRRKAGLVLLALAAAPLAGEGGLPILGLDSCVAEAMARGPDYRLAAADLSMARATRDLGAAKNAFGLGASAGVSRAVSHTNYTAVSGRSVATLIDPNANTSDTPQAALSLTGPLSTSLGLSASQILPEAGNVDAATRLALNLSSTLWDGYPGGRALGALRQADYAYAASGSQAAAARRAALYSVKQAYYLLLADQRQLDVLKTTLEARRADEARSQALYAAKAASGIDLRQSEYNRVLAELDLRKAGATLLADRQKLSALMGRSLDSEYLVAEVESLPPAPPAAAAAVAAALAARGELAQLDLEAASNRVALDLARAQYSPSVLASGNLSVFQDWSVSRSTADWSLGLQLSYPLIDSGTLDAQRRQALYQDDYYAAQRAQLAAGVQAAVQAAVDALADLLDRVELARKGLELAQAQYELAKGQFEAGSGSNLDLLNASVALGTAQSGLAQAKSAAQLGDLALQNALGN